MAQTDRATGLASASAIKVPCKAATTANITLSGEQTIDGVSCVSGDRVLVKNQTDSTQNGIYVVDTGTWDRAADWDGVYDVRKGTLTFVHSGSTNQGWWYVSTSDPITVGTTQVTIAQTSTALAVISAFIQTLIDDTSSAAARVTLGLGLTISSQSGNYTVLTSDQGKIISCTNGITVTLPTVASAGANFFVIVHNAGTSDVTVDGDGAETINGAATLKIPLGGFAFLVCSGSAWSGLRSPHTAIAGALVVPSTSTTITGSGSGVINFASEVYDTGSFHGSTASRLTVPSGYTYAKLSACIDVDALSTGALQVQITKNGAAVPGGGRLLHFLTTNFEVSYHYLNTPWLSVSANDYFELTAVNGSTSDAVFANSTAFPFFAIECK